MEQDKTHIMHLTKEEVDWVINRKAILDHVYLKRTEDWMPFLYPDVVYRSDDDYSEHVWRELKRQIEPTE